MAKCPKCKSTDTWCDEGPEFIEDGTMIQCTYVCDNCGAKWRAEYAVTPNDTELLTSGQDEEA